MLCRQGREPERAFIVTRLEEPLESYASFVGISNLSNVGYWSSTSLYHPTGYIFAKTVAPSTGIVYYGIKDSEFQRQHVWMVRAGD
jgi:hypothetical protein